MTESIYTKISLMKSHWFLHQENQCNEKLTSSMFGSILAQCRMLNGIIHLKTKNLSTKTSAIQPILLLKVLIKPEVGSTHFTPLRLWFLTQKLIKMWFLTVWY